MKRKTAFLFFKEKENKMVFFICLCFPHCHLLLLTVQASVLPFIMITIERVVATMLCPPFQFIISFFLFFFQSSSFKESPSTSSFTIVSPFFEVQLLFLTFLYCCCEREFSTRDIALYDHVNTMKKRGWTGR
ncbi:hypothetical protein ABB37_04033 [Leptomonas pyrrhocoris]|uniref:Uncharacterized protein n=1 Tax=Leptomonas pyrrhocoris TaxID=157538 RepID=A0A0M9G3X8_LEPPY|nr:hypothetical protein ABB37_04033 [Leptomonas pyrrhocoris]KPA81743.1 hypothetical protein ABB37_04033 [Leptomonas pyrrhocoris]|eukprot:XP_015660182.1 hypothetical protein ABB37_04033 [Leptomonas pyrrhocoris]